VSVVQTEVAEPAGLVRTARLVAADIKLAHSVFALPFALLGAVLAWVAAASAGTERTTGRLLTELLLVVVCMVSARTWAMVVNRLADRSIDARNPRTASRVFAAGQLSGRLGVGVLVACGLVFIASCAMFWVVAANPWPVLLSLPVLGWIALYSFTKRFTWLCHIFLGGALAVSPLAAALAIEPASLLNTPALWWIACMVLLWVAGFDVIYALQDLDFDRAHGLRSMPARFGWRGSIWISRLLHALSWAALLMAWRFEPVLGWIMGVGVGITGAVLIFEHAVLARRGRAGIPMAFFTLNGVLSVVLGVLGICDALL
jgi:4-hydroxybenzoate polyprenyltransferase